MRTWSMLIAVIVLFLVGLLAWMLDFVTFQGETTIYTADCRGGRWQGTECVGTLAAGDRYRFRALRAHREVLFWTVGSAGEPSGKFSDCVVQDGRNWSCKPEPGLALTITYQIVRGAPVPDTTGKARKFQQIPKWKWLVLEWTESPPASGKR